MKKIVLLLCVVQCCLIAQDIDKIPEWHPRLEIQSPDAIERGFYCKWGEHDNIPIYWRARTWLRGSDTPGVVMDTARVSSWEPVNSRSFTEDAEYEWVGWNSDCPKYELKHDIQTQKVVAKEVGTWGDQLDKKGPGAYIPTWRDGAEGAYSIVVEQLGMTSYEGTVEPAVEIAEEYPHINMGFATKVDVMSDEEWAKARMMVLQGHEIMNGSYDYRPVENRWFFFFHGDTISPDNPHIPRQIRGLVVDSTLAGGVQISYDVKYVEYPNGDIMNPESLSYRESYYVDDYSEDPNPDPEQNIYKNRGRIKAVHNGFDESIAKNVSMLKVRGNCFWTENSYAVNVETADSIINDNCYNHSEVLNQAPDFPEGFQSSSYSFPFNICGTKDISYIKNAGYLATKGGDNWGFPTPGDFYDPYRINYDVANILDANGTITYPNNPIMKLGMQEMVDNIIKSKGYMIRTINGCVDHDWDCNCPNPHPTWPGTVPKTLLKKHFAYLGDLISEKKLYVAPPSEIVKYRMTADAAMKKGDITFDDFGAQGEWVLSVNGGEVPQEYQDEISVIVVFDEGTPFLWSYYKSNHKKKPRYQPRRMDDDGKVWSVSINPFEEDLRLTNFMGSVIKGVDGIDSNSFVTCVNGKLNFQLSKGEYQTVLHSLNGRKILTRKICSQRANSMHSFPLTAVSTGVYLFSVIGEKGSVFSQKVIIQ